MKHAREDTATQQWIQQELNYVALHERRLGDDGRSSRSERAASESDVSPVPQSPDLPAPEP